MTEKKFEPAPLTVQDCLLDGVPEPALCESSPEYLAAFKAGIEYADRTRDRLVVNLVKYDRDDPEMAIEGLGDSEEVLRLSDVVVMRNAEIMRLESDVVGLQLAIQEALHWLDQSNEKTPEPKIAFAQRLLKARLGTRDDLAARLRHFKTLCDSASRVRIGTLQRAWRRVTEKLEEVEIPSLEEAEEILRSIGADPAEVGRRGVEFVAKLKAERATALAQGQAQLLETYGETFKKLADDSYSKPHEHAEGTCTYGAGYNDGFRDGKRSRMP